MRRIPKNLCETHTLGSATREWLVGVREVPTFRNTHTRVAGHTEARRGYAFVRHAPVFSQVLACTAGEGDVLVDGRWRRCGPGWAYLTAPRALCAYHVRPGRHWRVCWAIYEETVRLPTLESGRAPRLERMDALGLHLAIDGLCHEAGAAAEPATLEFWSALVHRQVMRSLQSDGDDPRLNQLWTEVRKDLGRAWNLDQLATRAGLSQESLRRSCQRYFGRSPFAHLTRLRMLFAADLLTCSEEKISAIAGRAGYADPFAFSNAFKRELGVPPSRYRSRPAAAPSVRLQPMANTPTPSAAVNRK